MTLIDEYCVAEWNVNATTDYRVLVQDNAIYSLPLKDDIIDVFLSSSTFGVVLLAILVD